MPGRVLVHAAVVLAMLWASVPAARAEEPTFPPGSRIGLVPPPGMVVSRSFQGFEDVERKTGILMGELPPQAFAELQKQMFTDAPPQQGFAIDKRGLLPFATGMGFLVTGTQELGGVPHRKWVVIAADPEFTLFVTVQRPDAAGAAYPDAAIRTALQSLTTRTVSAEEQLEQFPFKLNELAGFPHVKTLVRGIGVLLSDAAELVQERPEKPFMIVSIGPGAPPRPEDRGTFAQRLLGGVQGYRDLRITSSEPMRIAGLTGHEVRAEARHEASGTEVSLVQWVRFGPGGYLRVVGVVQKSDWPQAFARFRSVRDGVQPR
jgi:hypothetical protein